MRIAKIFAKILIFVIQLISFGIIDNLQNLRCCYNYRGFFLINKDLLTNFLYFCKVKRFKNKGVKMNNISTQTVNLRLRGTSKIEQKKYPETLKSCISLEEFKDLLDQKINEHYENPSNSNKKKSHKLPLGL